MKSFLEVIAESLAGWDGLHPSEPILKMVDTLTTEGRFDETTDILNTLLRQQNNSGVNHFVMARVPLKVLNNYVCKQPGLDQGLIEEKWAVDGVFETFKAAALREGALERTVAAFVSNVKALSECPQA